MCVKEFIGFNCGHCALPTLRPCPIASQSQHFPYCHYPAERPISVPENCPACARVVWNQRTLANEESHRGMHYRLGREGCEFDGEKGDCETRFDIDIEREGSGGGRQIRHAGYERVTAPGQLQIETSGGNAERREIGAGAANMRRNGAKKDRRKSSREIEEAIARVEARFAAVNMESSRRAAAGDSPVADQAYMDSPSASGNDLEIHAQQNLLNDARGLGAEAEYQMRSHHNSEYRYGPRKLSSCNASPLNSGSQVLPGSAYIGYQLGNEAPRHKALPSKENLNSTEEENNKGQQLHAARLSCETKGWVQNRIGTTKYYPGKEQYRGASLDEMIANVKYKPDTVVPRGPRFKQGRSVQSRGSAPQFTSQIPPSNFGAPILGANALPVNDFRHSQSTPSREIGAAARRLEPHGPPTNLPRIVNHPIYEGETEYSPPNRPYQGPAIVSSDMASTGCA